MMTYTDLVATHAVNMEISKAEADKQIMGVFETIFNELVNNKNRPESSLPNVSIPRFGRFKIKTSEAKTTTSFGKTHSYPAKYRIAFSAFAAAKGNL